MGKKSIMKYGFFIVIAVALVLLLATLPKIIEILKTDKIKTKGSSSVKKEL